jgi:hypothetical protein
MLHSMLVASDEATCGSVIRKAERISPRISGASLLLLLQCAVAVKHLHVAGVGSRAVEDFASPGNSPHLLGAKRIFEVGQLLAFEFEAVVDLRHRGRRRHEQVPQPRLARLGLQLLYDIDRLPAVTRRMLPLIIAGARPDILVDERANAIAEMGLPFGQLEIHRRASSSLHQLRSETR